MPSLSQARGIGAAGSILLLIGFVPNFGIIILAGLILILIAGKYLGEVFGDREIYPNMGIAAVLAIVGTVIGLIVLFRSLYSFTSSITGTNGATPLFGPFTPIILGLVLIWLFYLPASYFLKKSYDAIAEHAEIDLFRTAGRLFLVGAALTIVLGLGLIIIFIAAAIQVAAFLSLPDQKPVHSRVDPFGKPLK